MIRKEEYKPTIIVDTREKTPWKFNKSQRCNGSIQEGLKTGDYTIKGMEEIFVIERKKSAAELYQNLGPKKNKDRFWREIERMKAFKYRFIFLEFDVAEIYSFPSIAKRLTGYRTKIHPNYIISQLIKMQLEYGVQIIFLGDIKNDKKKNKIKSYINYFFYKMYNMFKEGRL